MMRITRGSPVAARRSTDVYAVALLSAREGWALDGVVRALCRGTDQALRIGQDGREAGEMQATLDKQPGAHGQESGGLAAELGHQVEPDRDGHLGGSGRCRRAPIARV